MEEIFSDAKLKLSCSVSPQGLFRTQAQGYLSVEGARALIAEFEKALKTHRRLVVAHDWWDLRNYDGDARAALTDFASKARAQMPRAEMLVQSAMLMMGCNAAGLVLKPLGVQLHATRDRHEFERRIAAASSENAA